MLMKSFENKLKKSLFLVIILLSVSLIAQSSNIEFENYSISEGLGQKWGIGPIAQDQDGYIWVSSLDGLNRFDGYEFKVYSNDNDDTTSLPSNWVTNLLVDSKNRLWIATRSDTNVFLSLYLPDMDSFKNYQSFNNISGVNVTFASIAYLKEDDSGMIWFCSGRDIYSLDPDLLILENHAANNKLSKELENKWIGVFYLDLNKNFWIGNDNLIRYNPKLDSIDLYKLDLGNSNSSQGYSITSIHEEKDGVLLIGANNNLMNMYDPSLNDIVKLPTNTGKYKYLQPPISNGPLHGISSIITIINRTRDEKLWISTLNAGLKVFSKNLEQSNLYGNDPNDKNNPRLNFINNFFEDSHQNIWMTTFNQGLIKVIPSKELFTLQGNGLTALHKTNSLSIRGIYEAKDKTLWIGTSNGIILSYNPQTKKKRLFETTLSENSTTKNPTGGDFQSFYEDPDGIIWIASIQGVLKYYPQNGLFEKAEYKIENKYRKSNEDIECIIPDTDEDYLWIATWGGGLFKHNRKSLETINYFNSSDPGSNRLWTIKKTKSGDLWTGTYNGLNLLDESDSTFKNYFNGTGVNSIYEDDEFNLWLGTRKGLFKFSPNKKIIGQYTKADGFPSDMIGGILGDDKNNLWIGTGRGLASFNMKSEVVRVFDEDNGALLDLFETANSYYKTEDGLLMFGSSTGTGITVFNPNNIQSNPYPPNVLITELNVFDNQSDSSVTFRNLKKNTHREFNLSYSQNDIVFNYVGIHYSNPKENKYKYKMEHYDNDWKDAGVLRSVRYTSLDPGEYLFKVKAANSDGVWSEKYASIRVVISPPWWKTIWAYSFYIIIGLGFLYSIRSIELKRQKKNAEIKESKLRAEAAEMQAKVAESQSRVIQAENDRKTKELEEARQLQLSMLPKELPKVDNLEIAVYMKTATEVGGDYYDFSIKENGALNVCLGDATGHGMKAGTLVAMIKSLFLANSVDKSISEFFSTSNEALKNSKLDKMMMAFAMLNIDGNKISMTNAGIPPFYIYRKEKQFVEEIKLNGLPLGAMNNTKYEIYESELLSGDVLLMLSDGFPELQNDKDEMYGYDRVISSFKKVAIKSSEEIINYLKDEGSNWVNGKDPNDDVTFVVIKVK